MKKRVVIGAGLALLLLALVGVGLGLRPTFAPDEMQDLTEPAKCRLVPTDEREKSDLAAFEYTWDLTSPPNETLLLGKDAPELTALLQPALWKIQCSMQPDGSYRLLSTPPPVHAKDPANQVHASYMAEFSTSFRQRHPDGTLHPVRTINLVCKIRLHRPFFQRPLQAFLIQEIKLDLIDGSADLIPPYTALFSARGMPHRFVKDAHHAALPGRYCGSACERLFTRLLFTLASIDSSPFAQSCTPDIVKSAAELMAMQTQADAAWPDCWGADADVARKVNRRIVPTLVRLQEADCYNHQELIDFINSPTFSRIFGQDFAAAPPPLSDMPPIIFEEADAKKSKKNESRLKD